MVVNGKRVIVVATFCLLCALACSGRAKTPITMWLSSQPAGVSQWLSEFEEAFNRDHAGIQLNAEMHPAVTPLREKLVVAIAGGIAPDIFYDSANVMPQWMITEIATPLDVYLAAMPDRGDFFPDVMQGLRYKGHTWALPFSVWPVGVLYNMDMLNSRGIAKPTNWDDMLTAVRRLVQRESDGKVTVYGCSTPTSDLGAVLDFQLALEQVGSTMIEVEGLSANLKTNEAHRALTYLTDIAEAGLRGPGSLPSLLNGTVGIQRQVLGYTLTRMADQISAATANVEFHRYVGPRADQSTVHVNAGTLFMVSATGHPDEAWQVMKSFAEPKNIRQYLLAHGSTLSARISQRNDRDLQKRPYALQQMASLFSPMASYGATNPFFPDFRLPAGSFLAKAIRGEMAIGTALESAEAIINSIIAERLTQLK
jgi:ABC-type glycerol-3-phosphate transport system substrate-binding protein